MFEVVETVVEDDANEGVRETCQTRRMAVQSNEWVEIPQDDDRVCTCHFNVTYDDPDVQAAALAPMAMLGIKGTEVQDNEGDQYDNWRREAPNVWRLGGYWAMYDDYRVFLKSPAQATVTYGHIVTEYTQI